jgi:hypothetical protein
MKISTYKMLLTAFLLFAAMACEKDEFNPEFELPRQFKPGDIGITAGETQVTLEWSPSLFTEGNNVTYTVQVSQDSSFAGTPLHTEQVSTAAVIITDSILQVMQTYFARVKANATGPTAESGWVHSNSFRITGEQIIQPVADADIKDVSVLLKWRPTAGLTKITLTPATGTATDVVLTPADVAANEKLITGLTPSTTYTAEIFRNTTIKGKMTFTTKEPSIFTVVLQPGDDLIAAVTNAADGDVIGLEPGVYDIKDATNVFANVNIVQKAITIQSVSGEPADTKVNFKVFVLRGTGAGVKFSGIEFDGTAGAAAYFIDFTGVAADAELATFETVTVENSIVHGTASALIRGNRGANNAYKIDSIRLRNSIFYDHGTGGFDYILLDKMEFRYLELINSTFYNSGRRMIGWATNFTAPQKPTVLVDHVTVNNLGYGGRDNLLIDANANPIDYTLSNSIIANSPKPGQTVGNNALRATGVGSNILITNNNMFKLSNGAATPADLLFSFTPVNHKTIDLGWTAATTDFTLPAGHELRTSSTTSGPIGDPRWTN